MILIRIQDNTIQAKAVVNLLKTKSFVEVISETNKQTDFDTQMEARNELVNLSKKLSSLKFLKKV